MCVSDLFVMLGVQAYVCVSLHTCASAPVCCFRSEGHTIVNDRFFKGTLRREHSGTSPSLSGSKIRMGMKMIDKEFAFVRHLPSGPGR